MDLYISKLIDQHIDTHMTNELVIQSLNRALAQETIVEGIIHHSNRGSQCAPYEYWEI